MPTCSICGSSLKLIFQRSACCFWACSVCGIERIYPQPDDAVLARIYGEHYDAWRLKEAEGVVKRMRQAAFSRALQVLGRLPPSARLLDCGAATGFLVEEVKAQGIDAYAIELSPVGAEACRRVVGPDHVYEGEVLDAWFPANPETRFEVITMFDFIEHVRDPRAVLRWASAHLRAGGSLLLVTPRVDSLSHRLLRRWWFHYHLEHLWYFSLAGLTALLQEVGLSITQVGPVYKNFSVAYAASLAQSYQSRDHNSLPGIARLFFLLNRICPGRFRSRSFALPAGEMLVHAQL